jgi:hypothetical protein
MHNAISVIALQWLALNRHRLADIIGAGSHSPT